MQSFSAPVSAPESGKTLTATEKEAGIDPPDSELLAGLKSRSTEAFEVLLDRFEAPLYRFFFYSHGKHELAEDQCAETFAALVTAFKKMRSGPAGLRAFVFGVARNVMRRGWRETRPPLSSPDALERLADGQPGAYREVSACQELERALAAIRTLDDPMRQILLLRVVEELTVKEIAEALALPPGSVRSHIHRARKKLRGILES